jgi:hypothetical protein
MEPALAAPVAPVASVEALPGAAAAEVIQPAAPDPTAAPTPKVPVVDAVIPKDYSSRWIFAGVVLIAAIGIIALIAYKKSRPSAVLPATIPNPE